MSSAIHSAGFAYFYGPVPKSPASSLAGFFSEQEIKRSDHLHISVIQNGSIRYRYDGGDPTSTSGHIIYEGEERMFRGANNIRNIKLVSDETAISPVIVAITLSSF